MIKITIQGPELSGLVTRALSQAGYSFRERVNAGRSGWRVVTVDVTAHAGTFEAWLKGQVPELRAVTVWGDGAPNRPEALPDWRVRENERRKAKRVAGIAKRAAYMERVRAGGRKEFSVFGPGGKAAATRVLESVGAEFTTRRGGAWAVFTVASTWTDDRLENWLSRALPGLIVHVIRA